MQNAFRVTDDAFGVAEARTDTQRKALARHPLAPKRGSGILPYRLSVANSVAWTYHGQYATMLEPWKRIERKSIFRVLIQWEEWTCLTHCYRKWNCYIYNRSS